MENLREIMRRRILTPNNATIKFADYLEAIGVSIASKKNSNKKYALIEGVRYDITITAYNSEYVTCRQYNSSGIISLFEKTGQIYLLNEDMLSVDAITRELNGEKYKNAKSIFRIENILPYMEINQVDMNLYKRTFLDVADSIGKELLTNTYLKLK